MRKNTFFAEKPLELGSKKFVLQTSLTNEGQLHYFEL